MKNNMENEVRSPKISLIAAMVMAGLALTGRSASAQSAEGYEWWATRVGADSVHNASSYSLNGKSYSPTSSKGAGITIAVTDTSVARHAEFISSTGSRVLDGYSYGTYGTNGITSDGGITHGTHVAGIAASGMTNGGIIGIAPDAWILPVQVLSDGGSGSSLSLLNGVRWAAANYVLNGTASYKRTIFNMSLGGKTAFGLDTLQTVKTSGSISVVAAGNDGLKDPSYPARYATDASVAGWVIVVGAVDSSNKMAYFSNRAGSAASYYMVAPGVSIYSTVGTTGYDTWNGTSMATPVVSGAAALVWGAWPYLKGNQVVNALLWSAKDLGTAGVDSVFGWGLLDVAKAMQPIGDTCVPTAQNNTCYTSGGSSTSGSTKPGKGTKTASFSSPFASGAAVLDSTAKVVGYDSVGRHFFFHVSKMLAPGGVNAAYNMDSWMAKGQPVTQVTNTGVIRFSVQGDPNAGITGFSYRQDVADNSYVMAFKGNGVIPFGLAHTNFRANAFVSGDNMKIPYLGLMESPVGMAYGRELADGLSLRVGQLVGGSAANRTVPDASAPYTPAVSSSAMLAEASKRIGPVELIATFGSMREDGSFLGASSAGRTTQGNTSFSTISSIVDLGSGISAMGSLTRGQSRGVTGDGAADFNTKTESSSFGLLKAGVFTEKDQLALSLSMPSRVTSGGATLNAGIDVNMDTGAPIYGQIPVSLAPQGQERRWELSWSTPIKSGNVALTALRRLEPNHNAAAPAENIVGARLTRSF